ncbi:MAG: hypothetical protein ACR2KT_17025 [Methylocella sp.]
MALAAIGVAVFAAIGLAGDSLRCPAARPEIPWANAAKIAAGGGAEAVPALGDFSASEIKVKSTAVMAISTCATSS